MFVQRSSLNESKWLLHDLLHCASENAEELRTKGPANRTVMKLWFYYYTVGIIRVMRSFSLFESRHTVLF